MDESVYSYRSARSLFPALLVVTFVKLTSRSAGTYPGRGLMITQTAPLIHLLSLNMIAPPRRIRYINNK